MGLSLGLTAGVLLGAALHRRRNEPGGGRLLGVLALACAMAVSLVPMAPGNPLTTPFAPFAHGDWVRQIPQQVYVLIKGAMLWVPLGFVLAVGGMDGGLRRWAPAGVIAFFLVGWPFFPGLRVTDVLEVLFAPVGIWLGLWFCERTGVRVDSPTEEGIAGSRPSTHNSHGFRGAS